MPKTKKNSSFQSIKGMHDILPSEQLYWEKIRKELKETAEAYNFLRIDTPIVENSDLFQRSLGETTDIVEKQMFTFQSRGGDKLTLRPEGTAGIMRSYIQYGLSHLGQPLKLYYDGPMFRYEQPQAGRYRQFNQAGFEIIGGGDEPIYDIQVILPIFRLLENLKIKNLIIHVNTIGCKNCRPAYRKKLIEYYKNHQKDLCKDCNRRFEDNPLRLLDCSNSDCAEIRKEAPAILDDLCNNCHKHFKSFLEYMEELGLPYELDSHLVRGLDYYNRTVFEIFTSGVSEEGKSFDLALAGGGRYDYLAEMLGGRSTSATGGAIGVERIVEALKLLKINFGARPKAKVFLINIGDLARKKSLALLEDFIRAGVRASESLGKDSLNAQLRAADKEGVEIALILGQKEAFSDSVIIRDMKSGVQETVLIKKAVAEVKKRLK
ncbi:MAG: histidine--tRNA ligase [Candidatus Pacebacteria bacterium]|nr:histidine--tRNA ligase [Candidatus Paceibacterota bacterium]